MLLHSRLNNAHETPRLRILLVENVLGRGTGYANTQLSGLSQCPVSIPKAQPRQYFRGEIRPAGGFVKIGKQEPPTCVWVPLVLLGAICEERQYYDKCLPSKMSHQSRKMIHERDMMIPQGSQYADSWHRLVNIIRQNPKSRANVEILPNTRSVLKLSQCEATVRIIGHDSEQPLHGGLLTKEQCMALKNFDRRIIGNFSYGITAWDHA